MSENADEVKTVIDAALKEYEEKDKRQEIHNNMVIRSHLIGVAWNIVSMGVSSEDTSMNRSTWDLYKKAEDFLKVQFDSVKVGKEQE